MEWQYIENVSDISPKYVICITLYVTPNQCRAVYYEHLLFRHDSTGVGLNPLNVDGSMMMLWETSAFLKF